MLTNLEIAALIECRKIIVGKPKKDMVAERSYYRNDMKLQSADKQHNFAVFMRLNIAYPENFSIGLDYTLPESSDRIILLRCNGDHGVHVNKVIDSEYITGQHIHKATQEALSAGLYPESYAQKTSEYYSYPEALAHFISIANIEDSCGLINQKYDTLDMFEEINDGTD